MGVEEALALQKSLKEPPMGVEEALALQKSLKEPPMGVEEALQMGVEEAPEGLCWAAVDGSFWKQHPPSQ